MRRIRARLFSVPGSALYFGRPLPQGADPIDDWLSRVYISPKGEVCLPGSALKSAMHAVARLVDDPIRTSLVYRGVAIPGSILMRHRTKKGARVMKTDLVRRIHWNRLRLNGTVRVRRAWPVLPTWSAVVDMIVFSDKLTDEYIKSLLTAAGSYIGLGAMRVQNGGTNGMFRCTRIFQPPLFK